MTLNIALNPVVRSANDLSDAEGIHHVLHRAFSPFRLRYTQEAFNATVVTQKVIEDRMKNPGIKIFVAAAADQIVGTVTARFIDEHDVYVGSMGVIPELGGRGVGRMLLSELEKFAILNSKRRLLLETYHVLHSAIALYEKFGFVRTGLTRDYYGIQLFQMKKEIQL